MIGRIRQNMEYSRRFAPKIRIDEVERVRRNHDAYRTDSITRLDHMLP